MKNKNDFVCPECNKTIDHSADHFIVGGHCPDGEFELKFCEECKPVVFANLGLPFSVSFDEH